MKLLGLNFYCIDWERLYRRRTKQYREARKQLDFFRKREKDLMKAVDVLNAENNSLLSKLNKTAAQMDAARLTHERFVNDIRTANAEKVSELHDYIEELEKQVYNLKAENTKLTKEPSQQIKALEEACDNLIEENHEYSAKIDTLRMQNASQRELLVELQAELDTYKQRHEHKKELKTARQQRYRENQRNKKQ